MVLVGTIMQVLQLAQHGLVWMIEWLRSSTSMQRHDISFIQLAMIEYCVDFRGLHEDRFANVGTSWCSIMQMPSPIHVHYGGVTLIRERVRHISNWGCVCCTIRGIVDEVPVCREYLCTCDAVLCFRVSVLVSQLDV